MIYNEDMKKGVMKRHLPGPRIVDFSSGIGYGDFLTILKPMFFTADVIAHGQFALANSSGIPFDVNCEEWTLEDFVKNHGLPSKLRIYLLYFTVSMSLDFVSFVMVIMLLHLSEY